MSGAPAFRSRLGYAFNEHLRQTWSYSLVDRDVYNVEVGASPFIINEAGTTLLSQVSQVLTLDYRDSRIYPHSGYVVEAGTDFAGLGGDARFVRGNLNAAYYIPLERQLGNPDWGINSPPAPVIWICCPAGARKSSTASSSAATICAALKPAARARMTPSPAIRWAGGSSGRRRRNCAFRCRCRPISA